MAGRITPWLGAALLLVVAPAAAAQEVDSVAARSSSEALRSSLDVLKRDSADSMTPGMREDVDAMIAKLEAMSSQIERGDSPDALRRTYSELLSIRRSLFARALESEESTAFDPSEVAFMHDRLRELSAALDTR